MRVLLLDTTSAPVSHRYMKSQLAEDARRRLAQDVKRMTAEQRLAVFVAHCELMAGLQSAGAAVQHRPRQAVPRNAN